MLDVENLSRSGIEPASFTVADGECVALRGPSGAGKSLLMRAIADLDPSSGRVSLDGDERSAMSAPAWRRQVAYVPAEPGWWSDTVGDHFSDWAKAEELIADLGLPREARGWPVARASTGERQRLALARALALDPRVLLLDEPTSGLDADAGGRAEALIEERRRAGASVLWVTHDGEQAARVASRLLTIEAGRLEAAGP